MKERNEPLGILGSVLVFLGVLQTGHVYILGSFRLCGGPSPHEQGLASPLDGLVGARRDVRHVHLMANKNKSASQKQPDEIDCPN